MPSFQPRPPDQHLVTTISRVESRTVNKRDGTTFTMYDIHTTAQAEPFSTTKRVIAEQAYEYLNAPAELAYNVKQNGDFTNYYLNGVSAPTGNPVGSAQRAQEAQEAFGRTPDYPQSSQGLTEKDRQIHRQTAAKVAATLHAASPGSAEDFWLNCEKLADYFDTGALPQRTWGTDSQEEDIPFAPTLGPYGL